MKHEKSREPASEGRAGGNVKTGESAKSLRNDTSLSQCHPVSQKRERGSKVEGEDDAVAIVCFVKLFK